MKNIFVHIIYRPNDRNYEVCMNNRDSDINESMNFIMNTIHNFALYETDHKNKERALSLNSFNIHDMDEFFTEAVSFLQSSQLDEFSYEYKHENFLKISISIEKKIESPFYFI